MPVLEGPAFPDATYEAYDTETPTGAQVLSVPDYYTHKLPKTQSRLEQYAIVREMRKDPTISLVRQLMVAPALLGPWSFEIEENAPEDARELIDAMLTPMRNTLIRSAFHGAIDYGWVGYEKYFEPIDGQIHLKYLKPLLVDYTDILAVRTTGQFFGFSQNHPDQSIEISVELPESFLHSWDVEGQYWYGQAPMENAYGPWTWWNTSNEAAQRFDKKIAGAHWVVQYPEGQSTYNGTPNTPNENIAADILKQLQSSGSIAIPRRIVEFIQDLEHPRAENAWDVKLETAQGNSASQFNDRLNYIDKLKVRALGFPERAILEGQFGTKAEAEAHADFAIANMEIRHEDLINDINHQIINQLLVLNYGPDAQNSVYLVRGSIADSSRNFLQEIYKMILQNPSGWLLEAPVIDRDTMRDQLRIPTDEEELQAMEDENGLLFEGRLMDQIRGRERDGVGDGERSERDSERGGEGNMGDQDS